MLLNNPEQAAASRPVEYQPVAVKTLLRPSASDADPGGWHWTLNPYRGCEVGCAFCPARVDQKDLLGFVDFERRIGVKTNLVEAFWRDVRSEAFQGRPIVIGSATEPWQPAEEQFRLTRSLLSAMAEVDGLDVRIHTRSSLIARDTDVLLRVAERNRLSIAFSLASMDDRINRLIEPKAPSSMRRLAGMEALARAGLQVGLDVAPFLPGLDEREVGLVSLLTRAANAGARFAGITFLELSIGQREMLLGHLHATTPAIGSRFRRIIGRRPLSAEEKESTVATFRALCGRLGLSAVEGGQVARGTERAAYPTQMQLFS